jgi:hypothetical protein
VEKELKKEKGERGKKTYKDNGTAPLQPYSNKSATTTNNNIPKRFYSFLSPSVCLTFYSLSSEMKGSTKQRLKGKEEGEIQLYAENAALSLYLRSFPPLADSLKRELLNSFFFSPPFYLFHVTSAESCGNLVKLSYSSNKTLKLRILSSKKKSTIE